MPNTKSIYFKAMGVPCTLCGHEHFLIWHQVEVEPFLGQETINEISRIAECLKCSNQRVLSSCIGMAHSIN